jgi:hypothetical protein
MKKLLAILGGFCLILMSLHGAPGCLAQGDQGLRERAQAFWDARVREDWAVLYRYLPVSDRSQVGLDEFTTFSKEKNPFRFLSFELGEMETAGELGWVKQVYTVQATGVSDVPPRKIENCQVWEKIDGNWFPISEKRRAEVPSRPPSMRPAAEEADLTKRVNEFWEAKEKEQWGLLYAYCDPEYRKTVSQEEFLGKKALHVYVAHSVEWAEVTGDRGKVRVTYLIRSSDPYLSKAAPEDDAIVEDWVKSEGVWYRLIPKKNPGE